MSEDQPLSNYPRTSTIRYFEVNRSILQGTPKVGIWLVAIYVVLTVTTLFNLTTQWDVDAKNRHAGLIIAQIITILVLGFFVSHWFAEAYRSVCGLRGMSPRFRSKQVISFCLNPFFGYLALAYFSDWLWAKTESDDAPSMTWKSLWSHYAPVNYFAIPIAIYDALIICQTILPLINGRPANPALGYAAAVLFPCILVAGHVLGVKLTNRILALSDQTNFLN